MARFSSDGVDIAYDDLAARIRGTVGPGEEVLTGAELTVETQSTFGQFVVLFIPFAFQGLVPLGCLSASSIHNRDGS